MTRGFQPLVAGLILGVILAMTFTYCFPHRHHWEYKFIFINSKQVNYENEVAEDLNKEGADGWEAASFSTPNAGDVSLAVILKRQK